MMYLREMPNGDLLADQGGPQPDVPPGYVRDAADPHRLHLVPVPTPCERRSVVKCLHNATAKRWWCSIDGKANRGLVNPGVCARCQKLVKPFMDPMHV